MGMTIASLCTLAHMTTRMRNVEEIKKVESLFQANASLEDVESGGINESGS